MPYVHLNRSFSEFDETENLEEAMPVSMRRHFGYDEMAWAQVLENRFVVILGEAGTGKTEEFKEQERVLNADGNPAFLIPIEDLADDHVAPALETRLEEWRLTQEKGTFLLDSIDEARLGHPTALRRALDNFVRLLSGDGNRASVVVSCRHDNWQAHPDIGTVKTAFQPLVQPERPREEQPLTNPGAATAPEVGATRAPIINLEPIEMDITILRMTELDDRQISVLAEHWGIEDVDVFMAALSDGDLQMFAARPRDLEWLTEHWKTKGRFGSFAEMNEINVQQKLLELNPTHLQRDEGISASKLRFGVEDLAAAAVLCERPMVALPYPEIVGGVPPRSITPSEVLPEWTNGEIAALLTRGIFEPATQGRVRFHQPMVMEYLTACWAARKVEAGVPVEGVRNLLIGQPFETAIAIPSKRAVLGWVITKIPKIRREVINIAPDVLLYCGDAQQIPVEERAQALHKFASKLRRTRTSDWTVYDSDIRRIADPALSPTVKKLLESEINNPEIALLLLRIVKFGRFSDCAPEVLSIVLDGNINDRIRGAAAYAVASVGTVEQVLELKQLVIEDVNISNGLRGAICSALFPNEITAQECILIARLGEGEAAYTHGGLENAFGFEIVDACPPIEMASLLSGLLELAHQEPFIVDQNINVISERYAWTIDPIARLFARILETLSPDRLPVDDLVRAYILLSRCKNNPDIIVVSQDSLVKALSESTTIHQPVYWGVVRDALIQAPEVHWSIWQIMNEPLRLGLDDLSWLVDDIVALTDNAELRVAFKSALDIWEIGNRPQRQADIIAQALEQSAASDELIAHVERSLQPVEDPVHQVDNEHRQRQENQQRAERELLAQARADFQLRIENIRQGEDFSALYYLQRHMRRLDSDNNSRWAQSNWQSLILDFGDDIANAARDGFKIVWKNWRPPLPYERAGDNSVEHGVVVGLSGLLIAAEDGDNFAEISDEEAEHAICYALREMNSFPEWFEGVVVSHPETIRTVIMDQLRAEVGAEIDAPDPGTTLQNIRSGFEVVRLLCAPLLIELISTGDPPRPKVLSDTLEILAKADTASRDQLITIAHGRAEECVASGDEDKLITWLVFWLSIDGHGAWNFIETLVEARAETPDPVVFKLAAGIGSKVWGARMLEGADFLRPEVLERIIPVIFTHVANEDDLPPQDEFDMGDRQHAEHCRNWLLQNLANQLGPEPQRVLLALAGANIGPHHVQTWIRKLADDQAAKAIEYEPWAPAGIAAFGSIHKKAPTSANDLFKIAVDRIETIKVDIETGDFGDRDLFRPNMPESAIQRWLAGRLERESRGQYNVVREEEVDGRKKPDIRLHHSVAGHVTNEIKPVEKGNRYTFSELMDALDTQLVGQYLRAANSQHGILTITMLSERRWDPRDGNGMIDFQELIERLNNRAREIVETNPEVEQLAVIGINFSNTGTR